MLNESTQTSKEMERKTLQNDFVQNGIRRWKHQQETARIKKYEEQKEMRQMLEKYWPWSQKTKPRGLTNLHLDGIYPEEEFRKAKRLIGPLGLGKPGGGAPRMTRNGKINVRTHEDPVLRFQWGTDLRAWVDNTFRYKTNKNDQEIYKKELDKMVQEKKLKEKEEKRERIDFERKQFLKTPPWGKPGPGGTLWRSPRNIGVNFLKSLGWTNDVTLRRLEEERIRHREQLRKEYDKFLKTKISGPNQITRLEPIVLPKETLKKQLRNPTKINIKPYVKETKLTPLLETGKANGVELVPLLAKPRATPSKVPLSSTDVTKGGMESYVPKWKQDGTAYLQDLSKQMNHKNKILQQNKTEDVETVRQHFNTWDGFWGRPGHGAPRSSIKKGCLDRLLYPQMVPIGVH